MRLSKTALQLKKVSLSISSTSSWIWSQVASALLQTASGSSTHLNQSSESQRLKKTAGLWLHKSAWHSVYNSLACRVICLAFGLQLTHMSCYLPGIRYTTPSHVVFSLEFFIITIHRSKCKFKRTMKAKGIPVKSSIRDRWVFLLHILEPCTLLTSLSTTHNTYH